MVPATTERDNRVRNTNMFARAAGEEMNSQKWKVFVTWAVA